MLEPFEFAHVYLALLDCTLITGAPGRKASPICAVRIPQAIRKPDKPL